MVAIDRMLRTLGATVTFAATAALLVYPLSREISKSARLQNAFSHSPSTASEFVNLSVSDTDHVQPLAVPFGREYFNADFSSSVWVKRAPTGSLTYEAAVCNGGRFWTQIQEAFNGNRPPGPVFSIESVGNGWSTMRDQKALESHWDGALNMMARALGISNDDPHPGFDYIESTTYGYYDQLYNPKFAAIISLQAFSPFVKLRDRQDPPPPPKEQIPLLIPPLNRLSDMQWTFWSDIAGNDVSKLRFIGHDHVNNADTMTIVRHIFQAKEGRDNVAWPGHSFAMESDEAKALLATPNSLNVAWLLTDHAAVLGRRSPEVTIWSADASNHVMVLWDLAPPSAHSSTLLSSL